MFDEHAESRENKQKNEKYLAIGKEWENKNTFYTF